MTVRIINRTLRLAIFLMAIAGAPAALVAATLEPVDIFALELALDPQISPDGKHIIYTRQRADMATDDYYTNLWVVDADGTNHRPLTSGSEHAGNPRWSPDGDRIAYIATRDGAPQIYVRWLDSGVATRLTSLAVPPTHLEWSPDGKFLSFVMPVAAPSRSFGTMPSPPPGAHWKPGAMVFDQARYRHDGTGYVQPGHYHLFVVPADGGVPRQITTGPFNHGGPDSLGRVYAWMPDGTALVASTARKSEPEILHRRYNNGLYLVPLDGGDVAPIIDRSGPEISPAVSPDGKHIAYVGFDDAGHHYQVARLYVIDRNGGDRRVLSADLDRDVEAPLWAPNGKGIYAYYVDGGVTKLALFDLKGSRRVIAEGLGSFHTAYSAAPSYSVARTGGVALQWTTLTSTGNIAIASPRGSVTRRITTLNDSLLAQRTLGRVEEIAYTSSKDNRRIQGWVVYPPDFDPGKKYPLILEIHGGPTTNYGARFDIEKQLMAAKGYVVLYVNPRGSTGYGAAFGNLIHNAFPGDEYDDLMSGVDAVMAKGFIDPKRLFVTGGSGGGTLTAWLISRTDRFRAAAVLYPVIDWQSMALTSDIMPEVFNWFFDGTSWDQVENYRRHSMLTYVDKVKTPAMVMCGEMDFRTPISESEQYYAALKWMGVDAVFVRMPLEPHGIRAIPSHFVAKLVNVIGWFDSWR